jgi:pimeloyl-ACP methyl ester carboxylesterase
MQRITPKALVFILVALLWAGPVISQTVGQSDQRPVIVFVHGLFQNSHSWHNWKAYFESRGYQVHAPSYPYHQGPPDSLNHRIDPRLTSLDFQQVLDYMSAYVDSLPQKPILVGHSIGGLVMQKLVEAGKVSMGIALAPANPRGISVSDWKYLRSNFRMVNPLRRRDKVCRPPLRWFRYTFFNTISDSLARSEHRQFFVPESRIIAKSSTARGQEIDFTKLHVPMLFISGEKDNDLPPSLIYKNFKAYTDPESIRQYYQFPGKSHYIASEPGWEDVASYVHEWIQNVQKSSAVANRYH